MTEAHANMSATTGTRTRATAHTRSSSRSRAWVGWIWFAAVMMIMVGSFNVIYGLVALFNDTYYAVTRQGLLVFDLTQWGWIHLIVGALAVVAGITLFTGALWARILAVALAGLNAIAQLAFMSAHPVWAMIAIALDVLVIWAVIVHGDELKDESWD
jgi:hypothetical protein